MQKGWAREGIILILEFVLLEKDYFGTCMLYQGYGNVNYFVMFSHDKESSGLISSHIDQLRLINFS